MAQLPRWLVFNAASAVLAFVCLVAIALPCYVSVWRPRNVQDSLYQVSATTNETAAALLPQDPSNSTQRTEVSFRCVPGCVLAHWVFCRWAAYLMQK